MIKFRKTDRGFSLIELMIVVAIMAILAAIAIPAFMRFAMKSKAAEAVSNLSAIVAAQETYKVENSVYSACPDTPIGWIKGPGASDAVPWPSGTNFDGVDSAGVVRYQYAVTVGTTNGEPWFTATAKGDLDENGEISLYTVSNDPDNKASESYPKVYHTGDYF